MRPDLRLELAGTFGDGSRTVRGRFEGVLAGKRRPTRAATPATARSRAVGQRRSVSAGWIQIVVSPLRPLFEAERAEGLPGGWLPEGLAAKDPRAGEKGEWPWLSPPRGR